MTWHRPHAQARTVGETLLCTRHQAALVARVHVEKIRRSCQPIACDVATRTVLIDYRDVEAITNPT